MLSIGFVSRLVRCAAPVLLSFFAFALHIHAQKAPSASTLTVNSGQAPPNLTCTVGGSPKTGSTAPTGTVTFTDLTESQTLGAAALAGPAAYTLQPFAASQSTLADETSLWFLASGDFNGDGITDIAFLYSDQNYELWVAVMLGNGDGTFQAPSAVDLFGFPGDLVPQPIVADVNGDGKPDLLIAYGSASAPVLSVSVLLGNGDGTFQAPIVDTWTGIGSPMAMAAGDFDGDGHVDLAVITLNPELQVFILNGDGSGNFTPQETSYFLSTGSGYGYAASEIRVADLRKNGKLDLIVLPDLVSQLQVLLGNGDGTFAQPQAAPAAATTDSFEIGDFNGDGFPDIAAYTEPSISSGARFVQILLAKGDGTYQAGSTYKASSFGNSRVTVLTGDFHGNGHQDLLLVPRGYPATQVYTGAGDGTFQLAGQFDLGTQFGLSIDAGDMTPGKFVANGPAGPESLAYVWPGVPQSTVGSILPTLAETATLPPYTFTSGPATRSLQCSYGGDSGHSGSVSQAASYVIPDIPAAMTSPAPNSVLTGPQATFTWTAGIGATGYILYLGTTVGAYNITSTGLTTATSVNYSALPTNGETIYARLYTVFPNRGVYSFHTDYVLTALKETPATLTSPAPNSVLSGPQATVSWTPGVGATGYILYLGTTPGAYDISSTGLTTATSINYSALPTNGETIYARLYTVFPDHGEYGVRSDYVFTAEKETPAAMTSPAPGSVLTGPQVTFTWTAGVGATGYILYLGTTVGAYDISSTGVKTATSLKYFWLPTNGETIYARLYTVFPNHGEYGVRSDYVFTAATAAATRPQ